MSREGAKEIIEGRIRLLDARRKIKNNFQRLLEHLTFETRDNAIIYFEHLLSSDYRHFESIDRTHLEVIVVNIKNTLESQWPLTQNDIDILVHEILDQISLDGLNILNQFVLKSWFNHVGIMYE